MYSAEVPFLDYRSKRHTSPHVIKNCPRTLSIFCIDSSARSGSAQGCAGGLDSSFEWAASYTSEYLLSTKKFRLFVAKHSIPASPEVQVCAVHAIVRYPHLRLPPRPVSLWHVCPRLWCISVRFSVVLRYCFQSVMIVLATALPIKALLLLHCPNIMLSGARSIAGGSRQTPCSSELTASNSIACLICSALHHLPL